MVEEVSVAATTSAPTVHPQIVHPQIEQPQTVQPPAERGPAPIRVFLLDDHDIVRGALADLLGRQSDIVVVGQCGRATDAVEVVRATRPDIALLDLQLPDGSGIDVCREIRASMPDVRCIMLTSFDDEDALLSAVLAGASGYLLKSARIDGLLDGLHRVARGDSLIDASTGEQLIERMRHGSSTGNRLAGLSSLEREVLDHVADARTDTEIAALTGMPVAEIAAIVADIGYKLGAHRRVQLAVLGAEARRRIG